MVAVSKRVLVVDDEQIVRDSCERVLKNAGYEVQTVCNGRDALAACRAQRFDVMLTDLRMPDMDGLEVAKALTSEFPDIRIIVITGYPSQDTAQQARELGVFDYIQKPVNPNRLTEATAEVLTHPPRFTSADFSVPDIGAAATLPLPAPAVVSPTVAEPAEISQAAPPEAVESEVTPVAEEEVLATAPAVETEKEMSTLAVLGLLAAAPIAGLAFVVFLPLIGFGMLFAAIGSRFGLNFARQSQ